MQTRWGECLLADRSDVDSALGHTGNVFLFFLKLFFLFALVELLLSDRTHEGIAGRVER